MDYISPTYWYNKVASPEHQITSTTGQVVGDIVMDPITWLSVGVVPLAKGVGKQVAKKSTKQLATSKLAKLPRYAHPNTDPKLALELTQERVRNGGAERLKQAVLEGTPEDVQIWKDSGLDINFYDRLPKLDNSTNYKMSASEFNQKTGLNVPPSKLGAGVTQGGYITFTDAPKLKGTIAEAHEYAHFAHEPSTMAPGIDYEWLRKNYGDHAVEYFKDGHNSELMARFTQVRNYFGLKEGEPVTKEMWDYAVKHYIVDTEADNNMTEFFQIVKKDKLQEFLDWANKNAPLWVIPVTSAATLDRFSEMLKKGGKLKTERFYFKRLNCLGKKKEDDYLQQHHF